MTLSERMNPMKKISFGDPSWRDMLLRAYSFRFTETPDFIQRNDHITTAVNPQHREGFDNISLLSMEKYSPGVKASLRCSFDGQGCPEIIIVEDTELCSDGVIRYGACFEVILYKDGVNVWRHYMDASNHRCYWHKRMALAMPITEKDVHVLNVEVADKSINFSVDGIGVYLRTEDLPEHFHIGTTACEGIVRLYELVID